MRSEANRKTRSAAGGWRGRRKLRIIFAGALLAGGCQTVRVPRPLPAGWAANHPHAQSEFWYGVARKPITSNDAAFHGILLYLDGSDPAGDYASRVKELKSRGMLSGAFKGEADEAVDRGTLAVALVKALKIKGGLTMRLTGTTPRYAVRALEFRGVYPPSSPNQILTGGEFVAVMQKAEEFESGSPADSPATVMPRQVRRVGGALAAARTNPARSTVAASSAAAPAAIASEMMPFYFPGPEQLDLTPVPAQRMAIYLDDDLAAGDGDHATEALSLATATPVQEVADVSSDATGAAPLPATPGSGAKRLRVVVTGVEGEAAEVRRSESAPWEKCQVGMTVRESAEFRTGSRSAVQFIIPPDQTFCLDSQGSLRVVDAVAQGHKASTDVGLQHGRVRYDLARNTGLASAATKPIQIEEAGLEHDALIRSPHSALSLRGTEVSLFEQAGFEPEAISLTGRAQYVNTFGRAVPLGGRRAAIIRGSQTSAVQQALARSTPAQSSYLARTDFETREISIVIQRGGFVVGNVVVGDLHLSDFPRLPGALDFVLQWTGTPQSPLNDLNLAVFSPLHTAANPDFVSNPPFIYSLNPNSPASQQIIASNYPSMSRSGGRITQNSIGPDGLEIAYWPKGFPVGGYRAFVFDLIDAKNPPLTQTNPVNYTLDVYLNGVHIYSNSSTIGFLQQSGGILETIPPSATGALAVKGSKPAGLKRTPKDAPVSGVRNSVSPERQTRSGPASAEPHTSRH